MTDLSRRVARRLLDFVADSNDTYFGATTAEPDPTGRGDVGADEVGFGHEPLGRRPHVELSRRLTLRSTHGWQWTRRPSWLCF